MPDIPRTPAPLRLDRPYSVEIVDILPLFPGAKLVTLAPLDSVPLRHLPGQYVLLSQGGGGDLPAPICSLYEAAGRFAVTVRGGGVVADALLRRRVGDRIGAIGPLGNSFDLDRLAGRDVLLMGVDEGMIPLRALIEALLADRERYGRLRLVCGARRPGSFLFATDLARWRERADFEILRTVVEPDRDWTEAVGVATKLLPGLDLDVERTDVVVAGPAVMYKFVLLGMRARGIGAEAIHLALGHHMQCGRGICGHCRMHDVHVCLDGPVFAYADLQDKPGVF